MADALFEDPRLAALYDPLDPDRSDLAAYAGMAAEFGVRSVLDVGAGTGTFCCVLACLGYTVTGLEPARASLDIACRKPYADRVTWIHGTAASLPASPSVDLVTMTANVAQVFVSDEEWRETLNAAHAALKPGGRLVFETRDPAAKAWERWNRADSFRRVEVLETPEIQETGAVETWHEVTSVSGELVTFSTITVFETDGAVLTSSSTLRFRSRAALARSLEAAGFAVEDVRDAPDRPGRELVFVARRL